MKKSVKGYKKDSPDINEPELLIESQFITTKNMAFPIQANNRILYPDTGDYYFPEGMVHEKPIMQKAGNFTSSLKDQLMATDLDMDLNMIAGPTLQKQGVERREMNLNPLQNTNLPDKTPQRPVNKKNFNPNFVPALGLFNTAIQRFSESKRGKEVENEYNRMQMMSNISSTIVPTEYGQYGNPYIYQEGGDIGEKVKVVPEGFNLLREDPNGIKVYNKKTSSTISMAKPSAKQGSPEYDAWLNKQAESVPVEELIKNKYIAPENADKYRKLYKAKEQFVHTAPEPIDPYANWSRRGQVIHADGKTIAEMWYPTSQTNDVTTQGNVNTANQKGMFRFRNDFGFTGEELSLDAPEIQQYLGTSQAFNTTEDYQKLLQLARSKIVKKQLGGVIPEFADYAPELQQPDVPVFNSAPSQVQPEMENAVYSPSSDNFKQFIIQKESSGNYMALPKKKDGSLASSAVGAYQFLWNSHKKDIQKLTGVSSKEEFRKNPQAQDMYFDYWDASVLTPTAMTIQRALGKNAPSIEQIKAKVHFAGPKGAKDYFFKGVETKDAFGTKTSTYKEGGDYEMSPEQLLQFLQNGGEVEIITE